MTGVDPPTRLYEVFHGDMKMSWYWRTRDAHNRKIVAIGGEGYSTPSNARRALRRMYGAEIKIDRVAA